MNKKTSDLLVFITRNEVTCSECKADLGRSAWITLVENKGPLCLTCADLDHLVFLPSGDPALTRRSRKHSTLSAVVLRWSRARNQYERQGLLVEELALQQAEQECLADSEARERRREREAVRREELDQQYIERFAQEVRKRFPGCPPGREMVIAEHACQKYSGRVGRSAAAKEFSEEAIWLAVTAHIRHAETDYDKLLAQGIERWEARQSVAGAVQDVVERWSS
jgi:hypothetical protein